MTLQNTPSTRKEKIVMLSVHGLGDTLMFLPTIRAVSQNFPLSEITVLVRNKSVKKMLETAALPDNVFIEQFRILNDWRFKRTAFKPLGSLLRFNPLNLWVFYKIRVLKPDISIVMTRMNNWLTPLMLKISGSRISVGESHGWGKYLYTNPVEADLKVHRVLRNLSLLKALGIPQADEPDTKLYPSQESVTKVCSLIKKRLGHLPGRYFAVTPCVTLGQRWRLWPCEYWAKLISLLTREFDSTCFILGGPSAEDKQIAEEISRRLADEARAYNLVGQLNIKETIALISVVDCVCGIDCGLLHIAASVDTFVHAIWSATPIEHYPFTDDKQIITVRCQCKENYPHNIRKECLKRPHCLENFSPEAAFEQIAKMWRTSQAQNRSVIGMTSKNCSDRID